MSVYPLAIDHNYYSQFNFLFAIVIPTRSCHIALSMLFGGRGGNSAREGGDSL